MVCLEDKSIFLKRKEIFNKEKLEAFENAIMRYYNVHAPIIVILIKV